MSLSATVLTLYPDMFPGPLEQSLAGRALENGVWALKTLNIRDFATDKHASVDDTPYGGGAGMVLKPDVVHLALSEAKNHHKKPVIIYTSPRGEPFSQKIAHELKNQELIIICGRFEGLDQRVIDHHQMREISIGDYVLSGGEIAAMAILDACVRLIPGVMGKDISANEESFAQTSNYAGLLEYPQYTRPPVWEGQKVPDVLLSGNHQEIEHWRLEQAKNITAARRPDLMKDKE